MSLLPSRAQPVGPSLAAPPRQPNLLPPPQLIIAGFFGLWRIVVTCQLAKCIEIGLPALVLLIFFSQYVLHAIIIRREIFNWFAVIFTIAIVWVYAHILTVSGAYRHRPPES